MATAKRLLPPWLAPASVAGEVTKYERKPDGVVKATFAVPVGSRDVPLEISVPAEPEEMTALAAALQELARVLLEHRPLPRQASLSGVR